MNVSTSNNTDNFFVNNSTSQFVTANDILKRYRITQMTLWRWINSADVKFPKPIYISKRRYFKINEIIEWENNRENKGAN